jgi:hypothetical protein
MVQGSAEEAQGVCAECEEGQEFCRREATGTEVKFSMESASLRARAFFATSQSRRSTTLMLAG